MIYNVGCQYCTNLTQTPELPTKLYPKRTPGIRAQIVNGELNILRYGILDTHLSIKYCPMCGRKFVKD